MKFRIRKESLMSRGLNKKPALLMPTTGGSTPIPLAASPLLAASPCWLGRQCLPPRVGADRKSARRNRERGNQRIRVRRDPKADLVELEQTACQLTSLA
jgi:hypothetical protein